MSRINEYNNSQKRLNILRVTANEIKSFKIRRKILLSLLAAVVTLTGLLYMAAALHRNMGRLSVGIAKDDIAHYGLTLSETRDMKHCTSRLTADIKERITNISRDDLPDNLSMIDGQHNGDNYIAYTFYLQHGGDVATDVEYAVTLKGVTLGLDAAMRVRLYIEDEYVEYAKTRDDGTGPEPYSTEFYSIDTVTMGTLEDYAPGDKTKFTIVIWLEGDDPECVDRVIDGMATVEMSFNAVPKAE